MSASGLRAGQLIAPSPPPQCRTLREKIGWAMANVLPPGRKARWKQVEMVDLIGRGLNMFEKDVDLEDPRYTDGLEDPGVDWYALSKSYLAALCQGTQCNPTLERVNTLGAFFVVRPALFVPGGFETIAAEIELVKFVVEHPEAYVLAQRGAQLNPDGRALLETYLSLLEQAAGRPVLQLPASGPVVPVPAGGAAPESRDGR